MEEVERGIDAEDCDIHKGDCTGEEDDRCATEDCGNHEDDCAIDEDGVES